MDHFDLHYGDAFDENSMSNNMINWAKVRRYSTVINDPPDIKHALQDVYIGRLENDKDIYHNDVRPLLTLGGWLYTEYTGGLLNNNNLEDIAGSQTGLLGPNYLADFSVWVHNKQDGAWKREKCVYEEKLPFSELSYTFPAYMNKPTRHEKHPSSLPRWELIQMAILDYVIFRGPTASKWFDFTINQKPRGIRLTSTTALSDIFDDDTGFDIAVQFRISAVAVAPLPSLTSTRDGKKETEANLNRAIFGQRRKSSGKTGMRKSRGKSSRKSKRKRPKTPRKRRRGSQARRK